MSAQLRSVAWQLALVVALLLGAYFAAPAQAPFLGRRVIIAAFIVWPVALWLLFAHLPNQRQRQPIPGLLLVFVMVFLLARGVALPIQDSALQPHRWLPGADSFTRWLGYALTIGMVQESVRYFVIRYTVWGYGLRARRDAIAYCACGAVAYALALNLELLQAAELSMRAAALAILETQFLQFAGALVLAYAISEVRQARAHPLLLPVLMIFAAMQTGLLIAARGGLANAAFAVPVSVASGLLGSLLILAGALAFMAFALLLFRWAERPTGGRLNLSDG